MKGLELIFYICCAVLGMFIASGFFNPAKANTATVSLTIPCNNGNWLHSPECQSPPQAFNIQTWGFDGYLENGKYWKQERITSSLMVFEMEQVKFLTDGKTIVYLD